MVGISHHSLPRPLTSNWITAPHSTKTDQLPCKHCSQYEPAAFGLCILPSDLFLKSNPSFPLSFLGAFWLVAQTAEAPTFIPDDIIPCEAINFGPLWATKQESGYEKKDLLCSEVKVRMGHCLSNTERKHPAPI